MASGEAAQLCDFTAAELGALAKACARAWAAGLRLGDAVVKITSVRGLQAAANVLGKEALADARLAAAQLRAARSAERLAALRAGALAR